MAGFDDPYYLIGLIFVPILFLIYKKMISKRRKEAMKFSHIGFIKSALGNKKKSKRAELLLYLNFLILALIIIIIRCNFSSKYLNIHNCS